VQRVPTAAYLRSAFCVIASLPRLCDAKDLE